MNTHIIDKTNKELDMCIFTALTITVVVLRCLDYNGVGLCINIYNTSLIIAGYSQLCIYFVLLLYVNNQVHLTHLSFSELQISNGSSPLTSLDLTSCCIPVTFVRPSKQIFFHFTYSLYSPFRARANQPMLLIAFGLVASRFRPHKDEQEKVANRIRSMRDL